MPKSPNQQSSHSKKPPKSSEVPALFLPPNKFGSSSDSSCSSSSTSSIPAVAPGAPVVKTSRMFSPQGSSAPAPATPPKAPAAPTAPIFAHASSSPKPQDRRAALLASLAGRPALRKTSSLPTKVAVTEELVNPMAQGRARLKSTKAQSSHGSSATPNSLIQKKITELISHNLKIKKQIKNAEENKNKELNDIGSNMAKKLAKIKLLKEHLIPLAEKELTIFKDLSPASHRTFKELENLKMEIKHALEGVKKGNLVGKTRFARRITELHNKAEQLNTDITGVLNSELLSKTSSGYTDELIKLEKYIETENEETQSETINEKHDKKKSVLEEKYDENEKALNNILKASSCHVGITTDALPQKAREEALARTQKPKPNTISFKSKQNFSSLEFEAMQKYKDDLDNFSNDRKDIDKFKTLTKYKNNFTTIQADFEQLKDDLKKAPPEEPALTDNESAVKSLQENNRVNSQRVLELQDEVERLKTALRKALPTFSSPSRSSATDSPRNAKLNALIPQTLVKQALSADQNVADGQNKVIEGLKSIIQKQEGEFASLEQITELKRRENANSQSTIKQLEEKIKSLNKTAQDNMIELQTMETMANIHINELVRLNSDRQPLIVLEEQKEDERPLVILADRAAGNQALATPELLADRAELKQPSAILEEYKEDEQPIDGNLANKPINNQHFNSSFLPRFTATAALTYAAKYGYEYLQGTTNNSIRQYINMSSLAFCLSSQVLLGSYLGRNSSWANAACVGFLATAAGVAMIPLVGLSLNMAPEFAIGIIGGTFVLALAYERLSTLNALANDR